MAHQYIECLALLFRIFNEVHTSSANHTLGPHPVTACHFGMLKYQFVVYTEGNANTVVSCQHIDAAARGTGMQIDHPVLITEVHGNYVRISFQVSDTYKANVTAGDNFFYLLFVFNDYCLHNYILLIELQRWKFILDIRAATGHLQALFFCLF